MYGLILVVIRTEELAPLQDRHIGQIAVDHTPKVQGRISPHRM